MQIRKWEAHRLCISIAYMYLACSLVHGSDSACSFYYKTYTRTLHKCTCTLATVAPKDVLRQHAIIKIMSAWRLTKSCRVSQWPRRLECPVPPTAPGWHRADHWTHHDHGGIPLAQTASDDTWDESQPHPKWGKRNREYRRVVSDRKDDAVMWLYMQ